MSWHQVYELLISIMTTQTGMPNLVYKQVIMMGVKFGCMSD